MQEPEEGPPGPPGDHGLDSSVLVLNRHYVAIRVISARRAFVLLFKDYAEAIELEGTDYLSFDFASWRDYSKLRAHVRGDHDQFVHTPRCDLLVPRVIRLSRFERVPHRTVRFNRRNVLLRDEHQCQYCGKRLPSSRLSLDHVVPRSRGGRSAWTNVVTACKPCNTRKGGRLPREARMRLLRPPSEPRTSPLVRTKLQHDGYSIWRHFLGHGDLAVDAG